jgi:hypothetical protein
MARKRPVEESIERLAEEKIYQTYVDILGRYYWVKVQM